MSDVHDCYLGRLGLGLLHTLGARFGYRLSKILLTLNNFGSLLAKLTDQRYNIIMFIIESEISVNVPFSLRLKKKMRSVKLKLNHRV